MVNTQGNGDGSYLPQHTIYMFSKVTKEECVCSTAAPNSNHYSYHSSAEYAVLAIINISKASTETGRLELASQVCQAMNQQVFFYVVNHGYIQEQTLRIFSIAKMTFDDVVREEKELSFGHHQRRKMHVNASLIDH
ncbi:hypothetical protein DFS33DRAFT_777232 [Desarmillaria ectypa]|nr:hypothetical protein DFS33DRAFT_777232 [Desarmillaria ectypa]